MRAPCKKVALIPRDWVQKGGTLKWKNSSFLSAPPLTSWTRYSNGFNLSRSDLHNTDRWTQVIELGEVEWKNRKENEFPSKLGNDGNGKGYIIYFSHWNNYGINLSFQCDSPLNPLYHSEFDVLDSLGRTWLFWRIKQHYLLSSQRLFPLTVIPLSILPLVQAGQLMCTDRECCVLLSISDVTLMPVQLPPWLAVTTTESQHCRRGKSNFMVHSVVNVLL